MRGITYKRNLFNDLWKWAAAEYSKLTKQVILYFPAVELRYEESYSITDAIFEFWFFLQLQANEKYK